MAPRNQLLNRSKALFAGHDEGAYTLPADLISYRDAILRLREMQTAANQRAMDADPGAVRSGSRPCSRTPFGRATSRTAGSRTSTGRRRRRSRPVPKPPCSTRPSGSRRASLVRAVTSSAFDLIETCLRPAMDDVLGKVRKAVEAAKGDPTTLPPRALARADKPVRDAFVIVEEAAERYGLIRSAQSALQMVTGDVDADAWALFHEINNLPALWPNYAWRNPAVVPPWPKEAAPRMVWLVRPEVGVWMPTSVELSDAYSRYVTTARTLNPRVRDDREGAPGLAVPGHVG